MSKYAVTKYKGTTVCVYLENDKELLAYILKNLGVHIVLNKGQDAQMGAKTEDLLKTLATYILFDAMNRRGPHGGMGEHQPLTAKELYDSINKFVNDCKGEDNGTKDTEDTETKDKI